MGLYVLLYGYRIHPLVARIDLLDIEAPGKKAQFNFLTSIAKSVYRVGTKRHAPNRHSFEDVQ
jgi:hypothetical protein